jgi:hypothetical protein
MICHQYRCVFVHIPKTAGMSIEQVFVDLMGLTWKTRAPLLLGRNEDPRRGPPKLEHLRAREYLACGHLTAAQLESYFKFSFVRNPWDRIVSEYKYRGYPVKVDFKTYLFKHLPPPGWSDAYSHVMPQYDFLHDEAGKLLVDFVGKYETLQAGFDTVCARLGIPPTRLPWVNRSLEKGRLTTLRALRKQLRRALWSWERKHTFGHYTEYYDDESRDLVACLYHKDIEAFGYSFDRNSGKSEE